MKNLRNIAIIAHVDHGKTSLVDTLLKQTQSLKNEAERSTERIMDQNALEKERGMTILAKNTAINWQDVKINIVDTPGHADFSGEVERILSMVDGVLLVVDANEGPMPQTRYVTQKSFSYGLKPLVVINKIDRPNAEPDRVVDDVFELFDQLNASDEQLDFPVIYTSALQGYATDDPSKVTDNMDILLNAILEKIPGPSLSETGPAQIQISSLSYSNYLGIIGIGRVNRGKLEKNKTMAIIDTNANVRNVKISNIMTYLGLQKTEVEVANTGDIVAISGIEGLSISDTICDVEHIEAMPSLELDPPTLSIELWVNDSPLAGKDGKLITSRHIWDRLQKEVMHNIALKVEQGATSNVFILSGRGELHLSVLLETMRREGFEMQVSRPQIIEREIDGEICEPMEEVTIDVDQKFQGDIIATLGERGGIMQDVASQADGRCRLIFHITSRQLIGYHNIFVNLCSGTGVFARRFLEYTPKENRKVIERTNGVLVSMVSGNCLAYALWNLQPRGKLFARPQDVVYEGMVIGINAREGDLVVNPCKAKKLTNIRASGSDEAIVLTPVIPLTLEYAMTFIASDELVELTPNNIRVRKKFLKEHERKRQNK